MRQRREDAIPRRERGDIGHVRYSPIETEIDTAIRCRQRDAARATPARTRRPATRARTLFSLSLRSPDVSALPDPSRECRDRGASA